MPLGHKWVHLKHAKVCKSVLLWHCYFEIKHGHHLATTCTCSRYFKYICLTWFGLQFCSYAAPVCSTYICSYMTDMQRYVRQSASSTMMFFANYLTLCAYDYMYTQLIHNVIRIYFTFYLLLSPTYFLFFSDFHPTSPHAVWVTTVVSASCFRQLRLFWTSWAMACWQISGCPRMVQLGCPIGGSWWSSGDVLLTPTVWLQ